MNFRVSSSIVLSYFNSIICQHTRFIYTEKSCFIIVNSLIRAFLLSLLYSETSD